MFAQWCGTKELEDSLKKLNGILMNFSAKVLMGGDKGIGACFVSFSWTSNFF